MAPLGNKKTITQEEKSVDFATGEQLTWSHEDEKKLVRKLDTRIFPVLIILFILNFIDRNNFSNARLKGLEADLNLSDVQYQTCLSILLVGYVLLQVPSNIYLNTISRPSLYLCTCVSVWGIISACTAATQNAAGAIVCRFFLGCVEAAFFPGCIYYLSRWYTRKEMQLRVTLLNAGNIAAQAFGGLIAAGILSGMDGKRGIPAWRWLFIMEGCLTIFVALVSQPILPDYPSSTGWLSERERAIAQARLLEDLGLAEGNDDEKDAGALHGLKQAAIDPKVWLLGLTYFLTIMGLSFNFFFPTITEALGYSTTDTLLLTAPPWLFAIAVSLPNAAHADATGERFFHFLCPALACIIGYIISMCTTATAARYVSLFLMTTGYASGFVVLAWISNTVPRPRAKRAAAIAIVNACGNIGSVPGTYVWRVEYGPWYRVPFGVCLAILGAACVSAALLRTYLVKENRRLAREEGEMGDGDGGGQRAEVSGFRYLY